mmetsp:Transcript_14125/g.50744  ORF Transcript_14125/g.50744 Transcript_14125/m.50744 type:complete len:239 (+) Transcript_14125:938-1654(+)|eukprot:31279-Pelagococcus_subviridis.AAC.3
MHFRQNSFAPPARPPHFFPPAALVTMSFTKASENFLSRVKSRMCRIGTHPRAATDFSPSLAAAYFFGSIGASVAAPPSVPTRAHTRISASREFIFMYGHDAQPPSLEHPSPPAGPGTTASPPMDGACVSPVAVTASAETGKTISHSTSGTPSALAFFSRACAARTMDVTIPVSVPSTKDKRSPLGCFRAIASSTRSTTKSKMFFVEPTTPMSRSRFASIASLNISPGTSKCAVWYASP